MHTIFISILITLTALAFLLSSEAQTTGRHDQQLLSTEAQTTARHDQPVLSTEAQTTVRHDQQLLSTEARVRGRNDRQRSKRGCHIRAVKPLMNDIIRNKMEKEMLNLIEYKLTFRNYNCNPMTTNVTRYHKADTWSRVSTYQGQILLSLAFNYGVLSLMTLTSGTNSTKVELEDIPSGCIGELPEEKKVELVRQLLMRDFKEDGNVSIAGEGRVCNKQITNQSGYAEFIDYCCSADTPTQAQVCELNDTNQWLRTIWLMLSVARYGVLLFGPLLFLSTIAKLANQQIPYVVKLVEPLEKTILFSKKEPDHKRYYVNRRVNLKKYNCSDFPMLNESLCKMQLSIGSNCELLDGKPFRSFIYDYRIGVNYTRLLLEDEVPIGFWNLMLKSVFFCELRKLGPFVDCCKQSICNKWPDFRWIKFWEAVGLILLVLLLPMPYYLRLLIFYFFEQDEVMSRTEAATSMGLKISYENSIVHYLLPTHPLLLCIYVIYFTIAMTIAFASKMKESPFYNIIIGSFENLRNLSLVGVLHMLVSNVIWPFEKFGLFGIFIVFIYWPIVLPITCLVSVCYCIPTIYLTIRMLFHRKISVLGKTFKPDLVKTEKSQQLLETKKLWKLFSDKRSSNGTRLNELECGKHERKTLISLLVSDSEVDMMKNDNPKTAGRLSKRTTMPTIMPTSTQKWISRFSGIIVHACTATFCVVAMYTVLVILSECIGCFVDIVVFTMMGIIVNAGALLKYVSLAILILVYAFNSFNNVEKKYLQLNKVLFNIVKDRVKELAKVTSLPSQLQENTGFKSQELSEQGKHEQSDDIAKGLSRYWLINDLVLFVDKKDVPRIPKKTF